MFELTKSRVGTNTFPIVKSKNMDMSIANQYSDKHTHIWLVNENNEILEDFNWNWKPSRKEFFNVHSFPRCLKHNKKPVDWYSVLLIPTQNRKETVKQPFVSSYNRTLDYPVYFYDISDNKTSSFKMNSLGLQYPNCEFVSGSNLNTVIQNIKCDETHFFLIDINVILENDILSQLNLDDIEIHDCISFGVTRQSTDNIFYDYSAMLIPTYVRTQKRIQFTKVSETVGKLMDISTPEKCWISAYRNTYLLQREIFNQNKRNKVLTDFLSKRDTEKSRMYHFVYDGSVAATTDLETGNDIGLTNCFDSVYMKNKFKESQRQNNEYVLTKSQQQQRQKALDKIYGKHIKVS